MQRQYRIEVCDSNWNVDGRLEQWDGLSMTHRVCEKGTGQVDCVATPHNRELLGGTAGRNVIVTGGLRPQAGMLRQGGEDAGGSSSTIKLTWTDTLAYLDQPMFPNPGTGTGQGPNTHDVRGGYVSSAILGYVDANIGPSARPERRAPGLIVGADPQAGVYLAAPLAARWDNLLEFLRPIALSNGVVFEVVTEDRAHVFQVRQARDLSKSVVFSSKLHNLGDGGYTLTAPEATAILVLGPGEDTARMAFPVTTEESRAQEQRWGFRRLYLHDSSSTVKANESLYATEVAAVAAAKVAEDAADDYAKYTAGLAKTAEGKADDAYEDVNATPAYKSQTSVEARAARTQADLAAQDHQVKVAERVTAEQDRDAAITAADLNATYVSLYAEAERKLEEKGETVEASYQILEGTFEFGVDFDLGDFVDVNGFVKPVREVTESVSGNSRKVVPVVGDYGATSGTQASLKSRDILAILRRSQTR